MSASTSRKSLDTRRFARARNSGIGLDGSVRLKKSATASNALIASCRDVTAAIQLSDEIATALAERCAVVALETTLVAHGFPAPEGVEVGLESERRVELGF